MQNKKTRLKTPSCNKHFILPDYFVIIIIRNHFKTVLMRYLLQIIKALSLIMKTWSGNGHLAQQSRHHLVHCHPAQEHQIQFPLLCTLGGCRWWFKHSRSCPRRGRRLNATLLLFFQPGPWFVDIWLISQREEDLYVYVWLSNKYKQIKIKTFKNLGVHICNHFHRGLSLFLILLSFIITGIDHSNSYSSLSLSLCLPMLMSTLRKQKGTLFIYIFVSSTLHSVWID